jgi:hypothetical protein
LWPCKIDIVVVRITGEAAVHARGPLTLWAMSGPRPVYLLATALKRKRSVARADVENENETICALRAVYDQNRMFKRSAAMNAFWRDALGGTMYWRSPVMKHHGVSA